ncbi:hypothetical protein ACFE04_001282 [Oxalis oulophora]
MLIGGPGTVTGLVLRIFQCGFAAASIGVIATASGFSKHSAFVYLMASMALQALWSFWMACLDVSALRGKRDFQNPTIFLIGVGHWVIAMLTLAGACSSAGVIVFYAKDLNLCKVDSHLPCGRRFEIPVILAFITWALIYVSSIMVWISSSTMAN